MAGASNVNANSTYDTLRQAECSSCQIGADKSAYWSPQLYYAHSNGTFEEVPNEGMTVYYVGRPGIANQSATVPFPPGFRMLSGSSTARSYDHTTLTYMNTRPVADRVSFHCIDAANNLAEQHYMFDTNCVNGMRAQVNFQSCWDGVNLYLPNQSHVDYVSGIDNGLCPPSHPVPLPGMFFEVLYWTNDIDQSQGGQFVFANGDTTGYGFHGDFYNGWDMDVLTPAVEQCLYPTGDDGVISNCPFLAPTDNSNFPRTCVERPPVVPEAVHGLLPRLPGCNSITSGPALAAQVLCPVNSTTPVPTSSSLPVSSYPTATFNSYISSLTTYLGSSVTLTPIATNTTYTTTISQTAGGIFAAETGGIGTALSNPFFARSATRETLWTDSIAGIAKRTPTNLAAFAPFQTTLVTVMRPNTIVTTITASTL